MTTPASLPAFWQRPYPLSRGVKAELLHTLAIVLFASVLIWASRPFGLGQLPDALADRLILELAGICLICDALLRSALPALWSRWRDDSGWNCGAELRRTLIELILLATAIVAWTHWRLQARPAAWDWLVGIGVTALCATGPVLIRVLITERTLRERHQSTLAPQGADSSARRARAVTTPITIAASDGQLQMDFAQWRFARAEQNYTTVVWCADGQRQERLLRLPLSELEQQLAAYPAFRSHRSYLISLDVITGAIGNAQGYQLSLSDIEDKVPVARSRLSAFRAAQSAQTETE